MRCWANTSAMREAGAAHESRWASRSKGTTRGSSTRRHGTRGKLRLHPEGQAGAARGGADCKHLHGADTRFPRWRKHGTREGRTTGAGCRIPSGSTLALRGKPGSIYLSFPYAAFEESVLLALSEIKAADIVPHTRKQLALSDTLAHLDGQRAEVAGKIVKTKKRLANDPDFDELADVLKTLATSHKSLSRQIEDLRGQLHATPHEETLGSIKTAYVAHADATPEELPELRLRLKQSIRDLIAEILGPGGSSSRTGAVGSRRPALPLRCRPCHADRHAKGQALGR